MRHALRLHPDAQSRAARGIEAAVTRPHPGALALTYRVTGAIGALALPPGAARARADELWRHTCFEAFVRAGDAPAYYEFNFAPSTQWAAYRFDNYRTAMRDAEAMETPHIETRTAGDLLEMNVTLDLSDLAGLPRDGPWRLALSAVIEEKDGGVSYWALVHPPGKADFHHPDSFALSLAGAWRI